MSLEPEAPDPHLVGLTERFWAPPKTKTAIRPQNVDLTGRTTALSDAAISAVLLRVLYLVKGIPVGEMATVVISGK